MAKKNVVDYNPDAPMYDINGNLVTVDTLPYQETDPEPTPDDKSENFDYLASLPTTEQELPEPQAGALDQQEEYNRQVFNNLLIIASRCPGVEYSVGQAGNCTFTLEQVIMLCYRVDFPDTDAGIAKRMSKLVRQGLWAKAGRGKYQAIDLMMMDVVGLLAELNKRDEERKNPTLR